MGKSKKTALLRRNGASIKIKLQPKLSFGDPIPVLDRRELLTMWNAYRRIAGYEPPVSFADGLARNLPGCRASQFPIAVKCNILTSTYIPIRCSANRLFRFVQDYLYLVTPAPRNARTDSVKL